jgi:dienelactone hydrolase
MITILVSLTLCFAAAAGDAPFYADKEDVLFYLDAQGEKQPVQSPADWELRRAHILANMQLVMGPLPDAARRVPLDMHIEEEIDAPEYVMRRITFAVESWDRLPAYLLIPKGLTSPAPAMLCLHPTGAEGKGIVVGLGGKENRDYARELAQRGYVTLAPDYPGFGDYTETRKALYEQGYVSCTMKGIWNHQRAVDLLESLPEVDPERIGCIGHSLGGHNTLFLGVFEPRIKVMVTSCGFNRFAKYYEGDLTGWTHDGYMPLIASVYDKDPARMPFDFTEILGALAPRPVFINAPLHDANFEVSGVYDCVNAARPVYALFGAEERLVAKHPDAGHDFPDDMRETAYTFVDGVLGKTGRSETVMQIGCAQIDITPAPGVELSGYVARRQPSTDVNDPLLARALYLDNGTTRLLWLHADVICFERDFAVALKARLQERLDLDPGQIVLSATHTHAGPATVRLNQCGEYEEEYTAGLADNLFALAIQAAEKTEAVAPFFAEGRCDLARDRRSRASAHTDPRVGTLAWKREDGSLAAVLTNYAMHQVALGSDNRLISGDIAGRAAAMLEEMLPGNPVILLTNGACGNINPPGHVENFDQLDAWAAEMADSIRSALEEARPVPPDLAYTMKTVMVPLDDGGPGGIERWTEGLRQGTGEGQDWLQVRIRTAADIWERQMIERRAAGTLPKSLDTEVQVLRIGGIYWVALGAEVFSTMGDGLRKATDETLYIVGYANGDMGYLPTPEAYDEGGYEVESAFIFYYSLRPERGAFGIVRDTAAGLVEALSKRGAV